MEEKREFCPDCRCRMQDVGIVNGFEFIEDGKHIFRGNKYEVRECPDDGVLIFREIGLMTDD